MVELGPGAATNVMDAAQRDSSLDCRNADRASSTALQLSPTDERTHGDQPERDTKHLHGQPLSVLAAPLVRV